MENVLLRRAERIAGNRDAGAAELLAETLPLLADALAAGPAATREVARVVCHGQPAMAPLWNACAAAVADHVHPGRFTRARAEMERAPAALTRAGSLALKDALLDVPAPHLLTLSYSSSVVRVLSALAGECAMQVTCGEGRPRFEGRRMAAELAAAGLVVTLATDAALTSHLDAASAVVVGADAFGATHWINKAGTRGLVAAAHLAGAPVFVVCTRDKALPDGRARDSHAQGAPDEVWPNAPAGIRIANPYFERIPVELATLFVVESGPVAPADLVHVLDRFRDSISLLLNEIST